MAKIGKINSISSKPKKKSVADRVSDLESRVEYQNVLIMKLHDEVVDLRGKGKQEEQKEEEDNDSSRGFNFFNKNAT